MGLVHQEWRLGTFLIVTQLIIVWRIYLGVLISRTFMINVYTKQTILGKETDRRRSLPPK